MFAGASAHLTRRPLRSCWFL